MKKPIPARLVVLGILIGAATATAGDLKSLVEAERAFARMSETRGIRAAFLANLASASVVFRPTPVAGRKFYEDRGEISGLLTWRPAFAEISRAGDFGYTTGPYELRKKDINESPSSCGHYVSIWRLQPHGTWKVVVDVGISHSCGGAKEPEIDFAKAVSSSPAAKNDDATRREDILGFDSGLAAAAAKDGGPSVLFNVLSESVRVYRPNRPPVLGRETARQTMAEAKGAWSWTPMGGLTADSGDLAYTYGLLRIGAESHSYFRIWKRTGNGWSIVLDLTNPVPVSIP